MKTSNLVPAANSRRPLRSRRVRQIRKGRSGNQTRDLELFEASGDDKAAGASFIGHLQVSTRMRFADAAEGFFQALNMIGNRAKDTELTIVAARGKYKWALLRVSEAGRMTFGVTNHSDRILPFLTIGVRGPNLIGGIWLPVSEIGPGETRVVEHAGHKCTAPERQEVFAVPDPWPEDRERYWEFKAKTSTPPARTGLLDDNHITIRTRLARSQ